MDVLSIDLEEILVFGKDATIGYIKEKFEHASYSEVEFNICTSITVEEICAVIPLVNKNLRTLIVKNVLWLNDECIELLTAYCNKITKLELSGCLNQITRSGIESIGRNCSSLLSLTILSSNECFSDANNPSKLNLWVLDNRLFPALINNLTSKLQHFALSGFSLLTNDALEKFLSNFRSTLLSLDFSDLAVVNDVTLNMVGSYCHQLIYLKLNFCKCISDCGIENLLLCQSEIKVLELCGCDKLTDNAIQLIGKNCKKLELIKLAGCKNLTEKSLKYLSTCEKLSFIDMQGTSIKYLPCCLMKLEFLKHLNVAGCQGILFPSLEVIQSSFSAILETMREYDISQRLTCFVLGNTQSGKTNLLLSLKEDSVNVADGVTLSASITKWYPFNMASDVSETIHSQKRNLLVECWDWGGRKTMESFPTIFFNKRSMFVITFNLTVYSSALSIPYIISMIQAKVPGAFIVIVGCFSDLSTVEKIKYLCDRVQLKVKEREEEEIREINEELKFLRSLGMFSKIGFKRKKLEWLLEHRPVIHKDIIIANQAGKGNNELRELILRTAINENYFPPYYVDDTLEQFYFHICLLKHANIGFLRWHEIVAIMYTYGVKDESKMWGMVKLLEELGCLLLLNKSVSSNLNKANSNVPLNDDLLCINPQLFAGVIGKIHCHHANAQHLLNELTQKDHINAVWPGKKPYEWTLRKAFDQVIENGLLRETIIPVFLVDWNLSVDQIERVIEALQLAYVMFSSVTNAAYEFELVVPSMKNLSVYKLYHLPMQGRLPYITQINAWLSTCPDTHIEVGWLFRFLSIRPPQLFLSLISTCIQLKLQSQILSYWQTGTYIKVCDIIVNVSQSNEKNSLQVLARVPLQHGSRHAVNRGWSCLAKYLHAIEKYLQSFNGIYYEILSSHSAKSVPLLDVIDKYETAVLKYPDILWWMPIKNSGSSPNVSPISSLNCLSWLESIAAQYMVYVSHSSDISEEVKVVMQALQDACFEVSNSKQSIVSSDLIIIILTARYFEGDHLSFIKNNSKDKRIVLAMFEEDLVLPNTSQELAFDKPLVDISGGVGTGMAYVPDYTQFRSLIETCNMTMFGHGTLGEENKRVSVLKSPDTTLVSSFRKPADHFSEIIRKCSVLTSDVEMRKVASTAVASAVALATAEHIAKQSCPTMGAKAAAMAAAVADAVANGDSEKAAKAVIATAEAVDEAVAFARSLQVKATFKTEDIKAKPRSIKSSICLLI